MRRISKPELYDKTDRELDGLSEEFQKAIGAAEEDAREAHAVVRDIRYVRGRKRRPEP
jgi:hypothetical protein